MVLFVVLGHVFLMIYFIILSLLFFIYFMCVLCMERVGKYRVVSAYRAVKFASHNVRILPNYDVLRDVTGHLNKVIKFTFWLRCMLFRMFFSVSNPVGTIVRRSMRYNVKMLATS